MTQNRIESLYGGTYEVTLPDDYIHILNCVCTFKLKKRWKCYNKGSYVQYSATRLTSDAWSTIINDFYNRPLPWRPYFYLHNVNRSTQKGDYLYDNSLPTNPFNTTTEDGTDWNNQYKTKPVDGITTITQENGGTTGMETENSTTDSVRMPFNLRDEIQVADDGTRMELRDSYKIEGTRAANTSKVRMEIRCGKDISVFELVGVQIDYLKAPQRIRLTQEQVDMIDDTSQMMEWPDSVCQEIINELTHIVMENQGDPRIQTHPTITTSIAQPAQQQAAPTAATTA